MTKSRSLLTESLATAVAVGIVVFSALWFTGGENARAPDATGFVVDQAVVVNTDGLNLRDDASSSAGVIEVLPEGTYAIVLDGPVTDTEYSWYLIDVDGLSGYVDGEFLADAVSAGTLAAGATVYVNTGTLNLRDDATTGGAIVSELPAGTAATVLDGPIDADGYAWYQLDVDGVTGWAVRDYLALAAGPDSTAVSGASLLVNTDTLNVRDVSGLSGSVLESLVLGESVTDLGVTEAVDGYDWEQVQTADGVTGWVVSTYLTADSADLLLTIDAVATVDTDSLNLRDAAGLSGSSIATLASGDSVTILSASEAADGYLWYQVNTTYGTGWIAGEFLSV